MGNVSGIKRKYGIKSPTYLWLIVELHDISMSFAERPVLQDISFEVNEGKTLCLIGPSGSGKSTILKIINGLLAPDSGVVRVFGEPVSPGGSEELRRRIGFVLQQPALFPHYTVGKNVEVVPELLGWSPEKRTSRTLELLELMRLDGEEFKNRYPPQLSGGQQQRVSIARALAANPKLILFDEPFSALDPIARAGLQDEVLRLKRKLKKTTVFVTHDITEAFKLGDEVIILNERRIVQRGTPQEIRKNPADDFVERFIQTAHA